jgi:hypothetical protein
MADTKISALTDGSPVAVDDEFVVARAGDNSKIDGEDLVAVLDRESATTDVTNTVTETTIFTFSVPANTLDTTRMLRLTTFGDYLNNNATGSSLTWRIKFGGTTVFADAISVSATSATRRPWCLQVWLASNNGTSSQSMSGTFLCGTAGGATTGLGNLDDDEIEAVTPFFNTASINQTSAQTFEVTVQWSAASANLSCRRFYAVLERL